VARFTALALLSLAFFLGVADGWGSALLAWCISLGFFLLAADAAWRERTRIVSSYAAEAAARRSRRGAAPPR
jgi:hypothetical protein